MNDTSLMNSLYLKKTKVSPTVDFNCETGVLELKGRSLPEQAYELYKPLIEWMDEYVKNPKEKTTVNLHLEYINSSSNKYILLILKKLDDFHKEGKHVEVHWFYDEEDDDSFDTVSEYKEVLGLPIFPHKEV